VILLLLHRAESCLLLGIEACLLDFRLTDRFEARLLFAAALRFVALLLLLGGDALSASRARRSASRRACCSACSFFLRSSSSCLMRSSSRDISSLREKRTDDSFCSAMSFTRGAENKSY
jgi:hypothetical protein